MNSESHHLRLDSLIPSIRDPTRRFTPRLAESNNSESTRTQLTESSLDSPSHSSTKRNLDPTTRLAESKNRLAESKAIFNLLTELFFQLAEFQTIFKQLAEYTFVTRRVPLDLIPNRTFQAMQLIQNVDLASYNPSIT